MMYIGDDVTWVLEKSFTFEAAHRLPHHDGKCARLHGHSFKCYVIVAGDVLATSGPSVDMLVDFGWLKQAMQPLLDNYLDHYYLNESLNLENPTSERIAVWIYNCLYARVSDLTFGIKLRGIRVEETCTSAATYIPS